MNLVYICYLGNLNSIGIAKKVIDKIYWLNKLGETTTGLLFYDSSEISVPNDEHIQYIKVGGLNQLLNTNPESGYRLLYQEIEKAVSPFKNHLFIFRYPLANVFLDQFLSIHGKHTVLEHNSKEEEELKLFLNKLTFRDKLYLIRTRTYKSLRKSKYDLKNELTFKKKVLNKALAGICVTSEISDYETKLSGGNYKTFTVTNGTDVNKIPLKAVALYNDEELRLVMVNSSATHWHGIDRVLNGLKKFTNVDKVKIDIIGKVLPEINKLCVELDLSKQVTFHGYLTGEKLSHFFDQAHIGIGTLALHRINLQEGAVLKVREYMSRGLPFIIGYRDTDLLENDELKKYHLQFESNDNPISFDEIWEFAKNVNLIDHKESKLRNIALKTVDTSVKMNQYVSILRGLKGL